MRERGKEQVWCEKLRQEDGGEAREGGAAV